MPSSRPSSPSPPLGEMQAVKAKVLNGVKRHKKYQKITQHADGGADGDEDEDEHVNGDDDVDQELFSVHTRSSSLSTLIELQSPTTAAQATPPLPTSAHPPPDETDECLQVASMTGLQYSVRREVAYYLLSIFTCALSSLLSFWFPVYSYTHRYRPCPLSVADFVLVLTRNGQHEFCPVERIAAHPASQQPTTLGRYHSPSPPLPPHERMICFRHSRYIYDEQSQTFLRLSSPSSLPYSSIAASLSHGHSSSSASSALSLHGPNVIDIPIPSIPTLLVREVLHPFFVFQLYSVVLWCFEQYYYFAACILIIAAVSIVTTLLETRRRLFALSELAHFTSTVTVLRAGQWSQLSSSALIPGDIVQVTTGVVPCDVALLSGSCVVNESMLTGESLPILKSNLDLANKAPDSPISLSSSSHTLFSATSVLQVKPDVAGDGRVVGQVVRTGWTTTKGSLILSILYPAPSSFRFVEQSYKFIASLFALSLVGFSISIYQLNRLDQPVSLMIIRALDLITIVVPPSLPLALSVGTNYALQSLRRQSVCCISPAKINVAGKVRVMCFDKTGTLTSDGMEMKGVRPVKDGEFTEFVERVIDKDEDEGDNKGKDGEDINGAVERRIKVRDSETFDTHDLDSSSSLSIPPSSTRAVHVDSTLHAALSCCHSLAVLNGELIGDPLEVQIFRSTGSTIIESSSAVDSSPSSSSSSSPSSSTAIRIPSSPSSSSLLHLLHQYEFQSSLQRMTVVSRTEGSGQHFVFTKGAPEVIQSLCTPSTVPSSFTSTFGGYARQGYRILAIAYKSISADMLTGDRELIRPSLESDLSMLALIVLENAVKPETAPTLRVLKEAKVRCVMVTGDYPVTAVSVAKECGLVGEGVRMYQGTMKDGDIEWRDSEDDSQRLDPLTLRPVNSSSSHPYELAITGDIFRHLISPSTPPAAFHRVLLSTAVFARMSPDQKSLLVTSLQSLSLYCGMCGDGANDCAALKAAHVGISLSSSEASIAAPFTYLKPNIRCVPLLLSEGRSALQTSFSLFKFIAMYSLIQFSAVILTYFVGSVMGNWQYLFQDMFVVFILTLTMGGVQAVDEVSIKRPSGNLLSLTNVVCVATHMALCIAFQLVVFFSVSRQSGYIAYQDQEGFSNGPETMETTSLYYFSNFQYLLYAVLFARGHPWKRPVYTAWRFTVWCCVVLFSSLALLFSSPDVGFWRSEDVDIPSEWRWRLLGLVIGQVWCSAVWDLVFLPRVTRWWKRRRMVGQGATVGSVYGHQKRTEGSGVKEYHRLRGEFERGWNRVRDEMGE